MSALTKSVLAAMAMAAGANAHILMAFPPPFGDPISSPLANTGAPPGGRAYPCQISGSVDPASMKITNVAAGAKLDVTFKGSAVHGGGSCQFSLSTDKVPTANSQFKVIHSVEGGCPARNTAGNLGNDPSMANPNVYSVPIPADLAAGQYTFAWTWINKIGNREFYMNCAAIQVGGAAAKRDMEGSTEPLEVEVFAERDVDEEEEIEARDIEEESDMEARDVEEEENDMEARDVEEEEEENEMEARDVEEEEENDMEARDVDEESELEARDVDEDSELEARDADDESDMEARDLGDDEEEFVKRAASVLDALPDMIIVNSAAADCKGNPEGSGAFKYAAPGASLETNEPVQDAAMILPQCRAGGNGKYTAAVAAGGAAPAATSGAAAASGSAAAPAATSGAATASGSAAAPATSAAAADSSAAAATDTPAAASGASAVAPASGAPAGTGFQTAMNAAGTAAASPAPAAKNAVHHDHKSACATKCPKQGIICISQTTFMNCGRPGDCSKTERVSAGTKCSGDRIVRRSWD